jgi:hypothetical protein
VVPAAEVMQRRHLGFFQHALGARFRYCHHTVAERERNDGGRFAIHTRCHLASSLSDLLCGRHGIVTRFMTVLFGLPKKNSICIIFRHSCRLLMQHAARQAPAKAANTPMTAWRTANIRRKSCPKPTRLVKNGAPDPTGTPRALSLSVAGGRHPAIGQANRGRGNLTPRIVNQPEV